MKTGYKVCDAMTRKPVSIEPTTTLEECAKIMAREHIGCILIKEGRKLLGVATEQDLVRKGIASGADPKTEEVCEIMERKLVTISPDKDLYEGLIIMRNLNIRHLPVVEKKQMIGLLTIKDILKIQPQLFDLIVEKFEIREEETKAQQPIDSEGVCQQCGNYAKKVTVCDGVNTCDNCKTD
ncbi:MAG: CBS domain-containing protein [archaeon]